MSAKGKIQFFILKNSIVPRNRTKLKHFIQSIFKSEDIALSFLNIIFCSDSYLLGINKKFLGHNYKTDVVSFDLAVPGKAVEGEVYISVDRVKSNAKRLKINATQEIHRVIFHGVLHLCGYNDQGPRQKAQMRRAEDSYLKKYLG